LGGKVVGFKAFTDLEIERGLGLDVGSGLIGELNIISYRNVTGSSK